MAKRKQKTDYYIKKKKLGLIRIKMLILNLPVMLKLYDVVITKTEATFLVVILFLAQFTPLPVII